MSNGSVTWQCRCFWGVRKNRPEIFKFPSFSHPTGKLLSSDCIRRCSSLFVGFARIHCSGVHRGKLPLTRLFYALCVILVCLSVVTLSFHLTPLASHQHVLSWNYVWASRWEGPGCHFTSGGVWAPASGGSFSLFSWFDAKRRKRRERSRDGSAALKGRIFTCSSPSFSFSFLLMAKENTDIDEEEERANQARMLSDIEIARQMQEEERQRHSFSSPFHHSQILILIVFWERV